MELAILFGGASFEHEISIVSAITVKSKLKGFDLKFIFCDQDHKFYLIEDAKMKSVTFSRGEHKKMPQLTPVKGGFEHKKRFSTDTYKLDVLNLVHGGDGEDGTLASLLDFYQINYIGPRSEACTFSFDKRYTKYYADALAIKVLPYEVIFTDSIRDVTTPYPFIVKPATLGSSIGVSIVHQESELDYALDVAFEFDKVVVIEPFIEGVKEFNLAGCFTQRGMEYSIIEEPQKNEFLDFEKKYMDFSRSAQVEAAIIDEVIVNKMHSAFEKLYRNTFDGALIRCDFFVIDKEVYLNEINPIPGSMANYLFDDFSATISALLQVLPKKNMPSVNYQYIHSISSAKGK